jgi:triosephosphate isomerase
VSKKAIAALAAGISPIVCVGEKKRANIAAAVKQVILELEDSLSGVPKEKAGKILLAYEPIWAISTTAGGKGNASLAEMEPVMAAMAEKFSELFGKRPKVLYGGSVNPENAGVYASCPSVQGVLVGGASLDKKKASEVVRLMAAK